MPGIGFKNLDFGTVKTDLLQLYIGTTSYFDEVLVDVYIGNPLLSKAGTSRFLETIHFPRNNLHYDYAPWEFRLSEPFSGKSDICFIVDRRCVFGGFEFVNERVFHKMYASKKDVGKIVIKGFAPEGNSISFKLGECVHMLEFKKNNSYTTQEFEIGEVQRINDLSFIFLPGSNFNFEWFKFI